ncbi:hypothetical protein CIG19_13860 [Enterobacterales bacterium CwR94]|nr:hypothetical protein CIG19_13860 [Enterobacterales bacterium CwR94]
MAVPGEKIPSAELDIRLGKPPGYVERRSGIASRYHAANDARQADLAAASLLNALQAACINYAGNAPGLA